MSAWLCRMRSAIEKPLQRRGLLATRHLRLPDFLGIGAQKAGTTWLCEQLRTHPAVYVPRRKELHYFDEHFHRPLSWYASHFRDAGDRCAGEITPAYAILPEDRVAFVAAVMPRLKAVLLLRDPVERAWSQTVMSLVERPGRPLESVTREELLRFVRSPAVILRSSYLHSIARWRRFLGEERLLVAFQEDIRTDPRALFRRACRFLGVDETHVPERCDAVVFAGLGLPMPDEVRDELVRSLGPELRELAAQLGEPAASWARRWLS